MKKSSLFLTGISLGSLGGYLFANRKILKKISQCTKKDFDEKHKDLSEEEKNQFKHKLWKFGHTAKEFFTNRERYEDMAVEYEVKKESKN